MNDETCPHCGAERQKYGLAKYYRCWSRVDDSSDRDTNCYERQIAQKDEEIERLEFEAAVGRKLTELLRSGATITGSPDCLTKDVDGGINGKLVIKYPEGEVK